MISPDRKRTSRKEFLKIVAVGATLATCAELRVACEPSLARKLSVEPNSVRGDEPFVVRLWDLSPGERVVLTAAFDDELGQEWSATAIFEADEEGKVDTSEQAPVEGSYEARDPMGLVWSALGGDFYAPSTGTSPIEMRARVGDREASAKVERYAMADGVEATEVREEGLDGRLFLPAGGGRPAPGVLVIGGSEGGLAPYVAWEAALLASHGFAALALTYFRGDYPGTENLPDDLPEDLVEVPLEYFEGAIGWLGDHGAVNPDRLGVVGHSRGGELALLLGANFRELKAVVSYVGSGVVSSSPEGDEPAWTYRGKPVPRVPYTEDPSTITRQQEQEAEIPVERTDGPVLLIAAGDDALWPSDRLSKIAMDRLERHDHPYDDELAVYPEAGHLIQAPYVPTAPGVARFGGEARANAKADEDSWRKVLGLLEERLKG